MLLCKEDLHLYQLPKVKKAPISIQFKDWSLLEPKLEPIGLKYCAKRARANGDSQEPLGAKLISFNMPFFTVRKFFLTFSLKVIPPFQMFDFFLEILASQLY